MNIHDGLAMAARHLFEKLNELSETCLKCKGKFMNQDLKRLVGDLSHCHNYHCAIRSWFYLQDGNLPLACLWHLQSHNLVQFTSYLFLKTVSTAELVEKFEDEMWYEDETEAIGRGECVSGLLATLVNLGPHSPRDIYLRGNDLLQQIMIRFVERLLSEAHPGTRKPVGFLPAMNALCAPSLLSAFCLLIVRLIVSHSPQSISLEHAVSEQANYTSAKTTPTIVNVLSFSVSSVGAHRVVRELGEMVANAGRPPNWRWLLTLVSTFLTSSDRALDALKHGAESWLLHACASSNATLLAAAVLCARQADSYAAWFAALHLRSASAFAFLFDFLAQLVPYELPLYLKIHVNKVPATPSDCRSTLAEYTALARARLAELGQTAADYVGLFGEYDTADEQEGRKADVQKVIANFQRTGQVTKAVLEASVFRRQFYEKVFLAELLNGNNPEHTEFIEKLHGIGKIPHGSYSRWKQQ